MIYEYQCPKCETIREVFHYGAEDQEVPNCCEPMKRVISVASFNGEKPFEARFEPAFGKVIHNKRQQRNVISELNEKNNMRIEEVGTDNLSSIKKKRKEYTRDW